MRSDYPAIPRSQWFPSKADMNAALKQLNALGGSAGNGLRASPFGLQGIPPDVDEVWAVIREHGEGGSGASGSGIDSAPSWFHSWRQIRFPENFLSMGIWEEDPLGIFGFPHLNPLIELNYQTIEAGQIVRAYRGWSNRCWFCIAGGSGTGSGHSYTFTCNADGSGGTLTPV